MYDEGSDGHGAVAHQAKNNRALGIDPTGEASPRLDEKAVLAAYSRWAPIYDWVFGKVFEAGRRAAEEIINRRSGRLLEVGVGTGLALPRYGSNLSVTGIDISPDMLAVAKKRVADEKLTNVEDLLEMDATRLAFPDASFDTVAVMYTITVVPHPDAVMAEVERVTRPGGEAIIVSHFASDGGIYKLVEGWLTPLTKKLGWRPDFPISRILGRPGFETVEIRRLGFLGLFTVARLRRRAA
ncbi:class I SAM-dependent methyltransferase [Pinisolibacter sp.]|uniref:class I SAM-dependent methyltransferase n=1 Tax=Pinisolibacter sp. TaxID=2172024 RepID=UPI002FDCA586